MAKGIVTVAFPAFEAHFIAFRRSGRDRISWFGTQRSAVFSAAKYEYPAIGCITPCFGTCQGNLACTISVPGVPLCKSCRLQSDYAAADALDRSLRKLLRTRRTPLDEHSYELLVAYVMVLHLNRVPLEEALRIAEGRCGAPTGLEPTPEQVAAWAEFAVGVFAHQAPVLVPRVCGPTTGGIKLQAAVR